MYTGNALVTVIMTAYNAEAYIKQSVDSMLNQTYTNIFCVIVNDGSTDGTIDILNGIKDPRVMVIDNKENRHVAYGLNCGLTHIKGEYVAILDADDVWQPHKLERQLEYLQNHPEHEGCFTWAELIDENGNVRDESYDTLRALLAYHTDTREDWLRFFFFAGNRLIHPSSMITIRAARELKKFNPFYLQALDMDWWIRFTKKFSFGVVEEKLINFRMHGKNASNYGEEPDSRSFRFYNEMMQIRYRFFDDMDRDLFISTFKRYFVCEDSFTEDELKCEQAFLMLKPFNQCKTNSAIALIKFEELMSNPITAELLWKKYHFGTREIGKYTGMNLYFDSYAEKVLSENTELKIIHERDQGKLHEAKAENDILKSNNRQLDEELRRVSDSLNTIVNSSSWKITAPIRKIKDRKK